MLRARSSGIDIAYDDLGNGEPALLMMPGWCANRTAFKDLAACCSRHRRTLAVDWRGHGQSGPATADFGEEALVQDALAVIEASGARQVVPVATAHAGWTGIELRRKLKERIPRLVLIDWIILEAPPPFLSALEGMQSPQRWRETVDAVFASWLQGVDLPHLTRFVRDEMGSYGFDMWARAAREISRAYREGGSPLKQLAAMAPPVPTLHLYAQPEHPGFLAAQQSFAASHPWFQVMKLDARSHYPTLEVPERVEREIERFLV